MSNPASSVVFTRDKSRHPNFRLLTSLYVESIHIIQPFCFKVRASAGARGAHRVSSFTPFRGHGRSSPMLVVYTHIRLTPCAMRIASGLLPPWFPLSCAPHGVAVKIVYSNNPSCDMAFFLSIFLFLELLYVLVKRLHARHHHVPVQTAVLPCAPKVVVPLA